MKHVTQNVCVYVCSVAALGNTWAVVQLRQSCGGNSFKRSLNGMPGTCLETEQPCVRANSALWAGGGGPNLDFLSGSSIDFFVPHTP